MQTLGIDLSTDPKKVWICEVDWSQSPPQITALDQLSLEPDPLAGAAGRATPRDPTAGGRRARGAMVRSEASLVAALVERIVAFGPSAERVVGIDAPFGWPAQFVEAIADWDDGDLQGFRKHPGLRLRATDRFVHSVTRVAPMSVSADRMGSTAMLLAEVLSRSAGRLDRRAFDRARGADGIAEVHPAAAMRSWTDEEGVPLMTASYKSWPIPRQTLVMRLAGAGLGIRPGEAQAMASSDDALDAWLCAVIARGVALEATHTPGEALDADGLVPRLGQGAPDSVETLTMRLDDARAAQEEAGRTAATEGWIHVPRRDSLASALGLTPPAQLPVLYPAPPAPARVHAPPAYGWRHGAFGQPGAAQEPYEDLFPYDDEEVGGRLHPWTDEDAPPLAPEDVAALEAWRAEPRDAAGRELTDADAGRQAAADENRADPRAGRSGEGQERRAA